MDEVQVLVIGWVVPDELYVKKLRWNGPNNNTCSLGIATLKTGVVGDGESNDIFTCDWNEEA